jgi:Helix-turn-helix domain
MQRTCKNRRYPTAAQAHELEQQLGLAGDLYNAALEQRIWAWRLFGHRQRRTGR